MCHFVQVDNCFLVYNNFMKDFIFETTDARQTPEWGTFLEHLHWKAEVFTSPSGHTIYAFIKIIPIIGTMVKIQHPKGPIPFEQIEEIVKKYNATVVIIEPDVTGFNEKEYRAHGYSVSKMRYVHSSTIKIDIRPSEDTLLRSFSQNARRNIKKASKSLDVKVIDLKNKDGESAMKSFYALYTALGKIKKFYVPGGDEIFAKMNAFRQNSSILFAYENNRTTPIAALWVGFCDKTMIYFHPGNSKRGYELQANYLLAWEAIRLAKKKGVFYFDFESIYDPRYPSENSKWKGYTEFKKKFGGEIVQFPASRIKIYSSLFKAFYTIGNILSR